MEAPKYSTLTIFFIQRASLVKYGIAIIDNKINSDGIPTTHQHDQQQRDDQEEEKTYLFVLVCRRGVGGSDYGKIYSCGGAIDLGETPEEAACREAFEESGIHIEPHEVCRFETVVSNTKIAHFYVICRSGCPSIHGALKKYAWEVLAEKEILGHPTIYGWAPLPVHELADYFQENPENCSPFSRLYLSMYDTFIKDKFSTRIPSLPNQRPIFLTVTVFLRKQIDMESTAKEMQQQQQLFVVVCRRAWEDRDYGQIYNFAYAKVSQSEQESVKEVACQEVFNKSGMTLLPNELKRFHYDNNPRIAHYYVIRCEGDHDISGPSGVHKLEVAEQYDILGYPVAGHCWATVPVHELAKHFNTDYHSKSAFSKLYLAMYQHVIDSLQSARSDR